MGNWKLTLDSDPDDPGATMELLFTPVDGERKTSMGVEEMVEYVNELEERALALANLVYQDDQELWQEPDAQVRSALALIALVKAPYGIVKERLKMRRKALEDTVDSVLALHSIDETKQRYQIGTRVILTRGKSVKHLKVMDMSTTGRISRFDPNHQMGTVQRPYQIEFDDGRLAWYAADEFKKEK